MRTVAPHPSGSSNHQQLTTMSKSTSIKDALKRWEERTKQSANAAKEIDLQFQWPPIEKMDQTLSSLVNCERLSLSTNMIDKISGLSASMRNLKILSLGRNYIKTVAGLEAVADTLQELWLSYNVIEKLKGIQVLRRLRILCLSNNLVKEWVEFNRLQELPGLESLVFVGNPLMESIGGGDSEQTWRSEATRRLPALKKLDGETIVAGGEVVAEDGGGAPVAATTAANAETS